MVALQPLQLALFRGAIAGELTESLSCDFRRQGRRLARLQFRIGQGYASYVIAEAGKDTSSDAGQAARPRPSKKHHIITTIVIIMDIFNIIIVCIIIILILMRWPNLKRSTQVGNTAES